MVHIVKGSDIRAGMLVKGEDGVRLIVESVDTQERHWGVRKARKDWLPDLRYTGWSGYLDPASTWEVCGWRKSPQPTGQ